MRVNINLASQKYEDVRRFFVVWGASLAILVVLTAGLAGLAYLKHNNVTKAEKDARDLRQKIAALQEERARQRREDNLPENRDVMQQKQFWNTQIFRRTLSWTELFNELQRIMPSRAFLNSVQPDLTPDSRLKLKLMIVGEKKDNALELIERMETSKRFHSTRLLTETLEKGERLGSSPTYKFEIETYYNPTGAAAPAKPATREGV
jgi:hypothetical protein